MKPFCGNELISSLKCFASPQIGADLTETTIKRFSGRADDDDDDSSLMGEESPE